MKLSVNCNLNDGVLRFAADELKKYIAKLDASEGAEELSFTLETDGELTVDGAAVEFSERDDGIKISLSKQRGKIIGTNPRSVLIGVYRLLTELGCRFLQPGEKFEYIPKCDLSAAEVNIEEKADIRYRGICIEGADSAENILDWVDWLPKLGYNTFFLQFKSVYMFLQRWYTHQGNPTLETRKVTEAELARIESDIMREMGKRGLRLQRMGHGWTGEVIGLPVDEGKADDGALSPQKRALLAQVNGRRGLFADAPTFTNLCLANHDAVEEFARRVAEYAKANPSVDDIYVWLADGANSICECGECQKTTPSDQYVGLLNRIDELMEENKLHQKIIFPLYQELLWAPIKAKLNKSDRFVLMFAPISRSFEYSYEDVSALPETPRYVRNKIEMPVNIEGNLAFYREWREKYSGDALVYDYPLGRAHYGDAGYLKITDILLRDIHTLKKLKLNGYISCQELRAFFPTAVPNYTMGRALWNNKTELRQCAEEWFTAAFGGAWEKALDYLSELSELQSPDYFNGKSERIQKDQAEKYIKAARTAETFAPSARREAASAAGIHRLYWERLCFHTEYTKKLSYALSLVAQGKPYKDAWEDFAGLIRENELNFQESLDVYRVQEVAEHYAGFKL